MSVSELHEWRLPGCSDDCWPRSHDPAAHELYGRLLERETQRREVVRTGPLTVDLKAEVVTVGGQEVHLSSREYGMLANLAERIGQWCSTTEILRDVWGPEWVSGKVVITDKKAYRQDLHNVSIRTYYLRQKLGSAAYLIETQQGNRGMRRLRIEVPT